MPYILEGDRQREEVEGVVKSMDAWFPSSVGELNYMLTKVAHRFLEVHGPTYQNYNNVIGALECSKLEIYRRLCAPYEDGKIAANGDVIPYGFNAQTGQLLEAHKR